MEKERERHTQRDTQTEREREIQRGRKRKKVSKRVRERNNSALLTIHSFAAVKHISSMTHTESSADRTFS